MGLLALFWGSSFLWIKLALVSFSPMQITLVRAALGATVLIALCYGMGHRLPRGRRVWGHLAVAALFGNAVPFALFAFGEQTVDSGVAGVLNSTTPLWALLLGILLGAERDLRPVRVAGLVVGFAGTLLIFAPWESGELTSWGALAMLVAALCYAISFNYIARYLSGRGTAPIVLSAAQITAATGLTALAMPVGGLTPVQLQWSAVIAVAILGVFGTGFSFVLNYRLIADEGPTNAATVGYLLPVVSVLLGALALDEDLNPRVVAGMVVVLVGVAMTRIQRRVPAPVPTPATTTTAVRSRV
ncbi:DMT family transporter [Actinophytocola xanthii]|uniref:EamA family transporter n=1 Tax=Actinophytocola xanthii TaxID=1912961 RepID=A0A1Q8CDP1_9PSEU|nr:DMT family transporter [Actinophytocola xanthii]OLF12452.1 EamA family transporter [Actinophytocola xanthii]